MAVKRACAAERPRASAGSGRSQAGVAGAQRTSEAWAAWRTASPRHARWGMRRAAPSRGVLRSTGRGVTRDVTRALGMLVQGCDGGVPLACVVAVRWLAEASHAREVQDAPELRKRLEDEHACLTSEPEACYQVGLLFYFGDATFPRDRARAVQAYDRGCNLGDARACNNLGDALAYGEGVERDVGRFAAIFGKACQLGEALGCANSGYMFEHGEGTARDLPRAKGLYRDACASGEVYGCLHAEMLAAQEAGAPRDPERALNLWRKACDKREARACAFVGVIYEDGPDGRARDSVKSLEAMNRACGLGDQRACEWAKGHNTP